MISGCVAKHSWQLTCIRNGQTKVWPTFGSDVTCLAPFSSFCWKCIRIYLIDFDIREIVFGFVFDVWPHAKPDQLIYVECKRNAIVIFAINTLLSCCSDSSLCIIFTISLIKFFGNCFFWWLSCLRQCKFVRFVRFTCELFVLNIEHTHHFTFSLAVLGARSASETKKKRRK